MQSTEVFVIFFSFFTQLMASIYLLKLLEVIRRRKKMSRSAKKIVVVDNQVPETY